MKLFRLFIVSLFIGSAANAFAAEDFVFHCIDDDRTPVWSTFTVVPMLNLPPNAESGLRRYQLVYIPKAERGRPAPAPKLINLSAPVVNDDNSTFKVTGIVKLPGEKVEGLRKYLGEADEALFNENPPKNVNVEFSLSFKYRQINSADPDESKDVGLFSYTIKFGNDINDIVVNNKPDDFSARQSRGPRCIAGLKERARG